MDRFSHCCWRIKVAPWRPRTSKPIVSSHLPTPALPRLCSFKAPRRLLTLGASDFTISAAAIPHVITFLTKPLATVAPAAAIATAQLILNASLPAPATTLALSSTTTPPPALLAASIGSSIPWAAWLQALSGSRDVLLLYGPGYVKARIGDAPVVDLWSEETQGSVVPISRLRATLLSARLRNVRRTHEAPKTIRIPTLPTADDSDSESDADSEHSSSLSSYSTDSATTLADPECSSPAKSSSVLPAAPPVLYRAPQRGPQLLPLAAPRSTSSLLPRLWRSALSITAQHAHLL
ncbi:hypothetical protein FB45DRAFT_923972 [Roridomyces roridus]|uniref:Uncharacterized protein n=1 Tax=Roridomyces roridus TaxID=1738132 RepID=A0AAD7BLV3_9AGAR|nr:hypothetical protein FB45DRAFT_923972 [Roridomyces roridus]